MMFLRMAILNLRKNRRRTALIVFAIMISVLVMEVMAGMFEGMKVNFFRNLTRESGHIQIHGPGYADRLNPYSLDHTIGEYHRITDAIRAIPGVRAAEQVLHFGALLEHRGRDLMIAGAGVSPDTLFFRDVREGLSPGSTFLSHGDEPSPGSPGILLSSAVAHLLHLNQGDPVNVIVEDSTGSPYYQQFPVTGIFTTASPDFDENVFFMDHGEAQELVYLPDRTVEIRLRLTHPDEAESVAGEIPARLREAGIDATPVISTWRDVHGGLTALLEMMDFFVLMMNLTVVVVVAGVITNAILMNVFERMQVIGTMRAIGLKRRTAGAMILTEGVIQGVVGSALGLVLGIPVVLYFSVHGIDWGGISEAFGMGSAYYYFGYSVRNSAISAVGGILIALGGSAYAARAGTRLSVMEALRYV